MMMVGSDDYDDDDDDDDAMTDDERGGGGGDGHGRCTSLAYAASLLAFRASPALLAQYSAHCRAFDDNDDDGGGIEDAWTSSTGRACVGICYRWARSLRLRMQR